MTGPLPDPGWAPIVITAREVYDAVIRLSSQLTTMQVELVQHTDEHRSREQEHQREREAIEEWRKDHETRIRAQEGARWPLPSLAGLASLAAIAALVLAFVPHK